MIDAFLGLASSTRFTKLGFVFGYDTSETTRRAFSGYESVYKIIEKIYRECTHCNMSEIGGGGGGGGAGLLYRETHCSMSTNHIQGLFTEQ